MKKWDAKNSAPLAVIMISLNEAHNMRSVLENLKDFAAEVFLVDSYSNDETIDIALEYGVHVVQHPFKGFGDQWNFALENLPISQSWTMKLDPDERLTDILKNSIRSAIEKDQYEGLSLDRRLWFMQSPMPVRQEILRLWKTGKCRFSDVLVNEHPIVEGKLGKVEGDMEHHDSPHLFHWLEKQNRYSSAEAFSAFQGSEMAAKPSVFGNALERRMWLKSIYKYIPLRHFLMFCYCYFYLGAWRAGHAGYTWAKLRCFVFQMREYKLKELKIMGGIYQLPKVAKGDPDKRVRQYE